MTQPKPTDKKPVKKASGRKTDTVPNLDEFLQGKKKTYVSYMDGAKYYSMNYYAFVKLAKQAGANIRIKKKVVVDLDKVEKYVEENCEGGDEDVQEIDE